MSLILHAALAVSTLGSLAVILVSLGVISGERFHALPGWLRAALIGCVAVSAMVCLVDFICRWREVRGRQGENDP